MINQISLKQVLPLCIIHALRLYQIKSTKVTQKKMKKLWTMTPLAHKADPGWVPKGSKKWDRSLSPTDVVEVEARLHSALGGSGCGISPSVWFAMDKRMELTFGKPQTKFIQTMNFQGLADINPNLWNDVKEKGFENYRRRDGQWQTKRRIESESMESEKLGYRSKLVTSVETTTEAPLWLLTALVTTRRIWRKEYQVRKRELSVFVHLSVVVTQTDDREPLVNFECEAEAEVRGQDIYNTGYISDVRQAVQLVMTTIASFFSPLGDRLLWALDEEKIQDPSIELEVDALPDSFWRATKVPKLRNSDGMKSNQTVASYQTEKTDGYPVLVYINDKGQALLARASNQEQPTFVRIDHELTGLRGNSKGVLFAGEFVVHRLVIYVFDILWTSTEDVFSDFTQKIDAMNNLFSTELSPPQFKTVRLVAKSFVPVERNVLGAIKDRLNPDIVSDNGTENHVSDGMVIQANRPMDVVFKVKLPQQISVDMAVNSADEFDDITEFMETLAFTRASGRNEAFSSRVWVPGWMTLIGKSRIANVYESNGWMQVYTQIHRKAVIEFTFNIDRSAVGSSLLPGRWRLDKDEPNSTLAVVSSAWICQNPFPDDLRDVDQRTSTLTELRRRGISAGELFVQLTEEWNNSGRFEDLFGGTQGEPPIEEDDSKEATISLGSRKGQKRRRTQPPSAVARVIEIEEPPTGEFASPLYIPGGGDDGEDLAENRMIDDEDEEPPRSRLTPPKREDKMQNDLYRDVWSRIHSLI